MIDIEFTEVYQDHSVTVDLCPLAYSITDDTNITAWLLVGNTDFNIVLGNDTANILPLLPTSPAPLPTEYINITINITYTETTTEEYSFTVTETSTTQVNFTATTTTQVNFTATETTTEELTLTSTTTEQFNFTQNKTVTTTVTNNSTATSISVTTTRITMTSTVETCTATEQQPFTVSTQTSCKAVTTSAGSPERYIGEGQVAVASNSLYGIIVAIIVVFVVLLIVSIVVCYVSYRYGMSKGRRLEVEQEYQNHVYDYTTDGDSRGLVKNEAYDYADRESVNNPLYDRVNQ